MSDYLSDQVSVASTLRGSPGKWATVISIPTEHQGIPSVKLRDMAAAVNMGEEPWNPVGAFEAVIGHGTDLYIVFHSDVPPVDIVEVTYRVSLQFGPCFDCGRPVEYVLPSCAVMLCALCAAKAAMNGDVVAALLRP